MTQLTHAASAVSPIGDPSRPRRLVKVVTWLVGLVALLLVLELLGVDVRGWLSDFWDSLRDIPAQYVVAGVAFQAAQTTLTALAWLAILRAAYADVEIPFAPILTAYSVAVALNNVLPANLGTLALLFMFVAIVPGSTFAGVFSGYLVHKIFWTVAGTFVYLYLFLSVGGSFGIELGFLQDHPALFLGMLAGAVFLCVTLVRAFWPKLSGLWRQAKQGGQVLGSPRRYLLRVALPEFLAWIAKFGVIGVFLAAYSIPVTFDTLMTVAGGNSIANTVSVTPGGVGVNQAMNVASLREVTDAETATAYSVAQQLVTTAWNMLFAVVLVVIVFGWTGGKVLVSSSLADARERAAQMRRKKDRESPDPVEP
jgi:uncharacterized membrane protein YbhN (UPF0104 family)